MLLRRLLATGRHELVREFFTAFVENLPGIALDHEEPFRCFFR